MDPVEQHKSNTPELPKSMLPPGLMRLEERIVLDGAAPADNSNASADGADAGHQDAGPEITTDHDDTNAEDNNKRDDTGSDTVQHDAIAAAPHELTDPADPLRPNDFLQPRPVQWTSMRVEAPAEAQTSDLTSPADQLPGYLQNIFHDALSRLASTQQNADALQQSSSNGDPAESADDPDADQATPTNGTDADDSNDVRVLIVDSSVDGASALVDAAQDDVQTAVIDSDNSTLDSVLDEVRELLQGSRADSISLATHGAGGGAFALAGDTIVSVETLSDPAMREFWSQLGSMVADDGRIDLLACDAGAGEAGAQLLTLLEEVTGVNVAASTDDTGNESAGGDWILESDNVDAQQTYFDPARLLAFASTLDNAPTITDTDPGTVAYGGESAVVVDPGITVDDGDVGTDLLDGAFIYFKNGFNAGQDHLAYNSTLAAGFGINGSYDSTQGWLRLWGSASASDYQAVLRTVTYENTSSVPNTTARDIFFVIGDSPTGFQYIQPTGHYYRVVNTALTHANAMNAAQASSYFGLQGYLATITDVAEHWEFNANITLPADSWIDGSDAVTEDDWRFENGPEAGTAIAYFNWESGQPNEGTAQNYLVMQPDGEYHDRADTDTHPYVIEYGGLATDMEGQLAAKVSVTVIDRNDAPVVDNTGDMNLSAIDEDPASNLGTTVADIIASAGGDRITDGDPADPEGIAVTAIDNTNGTWQYSVDAGSSWSDIAGVSENAALLLRAGDKIRFQPNAEWSGSVTDGMTFRAWDQTSGSAGGQVDVTTNGGESAFSTATETAGIVVNNVDDVPIVDLDSTAAGLDASDSYDPGADGLAFMPSVDVTDVDDTQLSKVTIELTAQPDGNAEYLQLSGALPAGISVDAGSCTGPDVAGGQYHTLVLTGVDTFANYATALALVQYRDTLVAGNADLTNRTVRVIAYDGDNGAVISTPRTATIAMNPLVDLNGGSAGLNESAAFVENTGATTVTPNATIGADLTVSQITITLTNPLDGVAESLQATGTAQVDVTGNGTHTLTLTGLGGHTNADFQTVLQTLSYANTGTNPDTTTRLIDIQPDVTPGAASSRTAQVTVSQANDAPNLDNTGAMTLTSLPEDATNNGGDTVADIIASAGGDRITDTDTGALEGIAIQATDSTNGNWQYSLDGTNWIDIGTVAENSALLLRATDYVRFQPNPGWSGSLATAITFRAWDQTAGAAGSKIDVSSNGLNTAYSSQTETASINVSSVDDAPVVDLDTTTGSNDASASYDPGAAAVSLLTDVAFTDPDDANLSRVVITLTNQPDGNAEYLQLAGALPGGITVDAGNSTGPDVAGGKYHTLVLTGADTLANYVAAVELLQYQNGLVSGSADTSDRLVEITAYDGDSAALASATQNVTIAMNPTADLNGSAVVGFDAQASFVEASGGVTLTPDALLTSAAAITRVTLTLSNAQDGVMETLTATGNAKISVTGNGTHTLVLEGLGGQTNADFQQVLRTVQYDHTGSPPDTTTRIIQVVPETAAGNGAARSIDVTVSLVNHAPALDNSDSLSLSTIAYENVNNAGDTVSTVLASAASDPITDIDAGAVEGIAVTAIDSTNGNWQYSIDAGATWVDVGAVSEASALLLDATSLVRFQPNAGWSGTTASAITFRAWDQTSGAVGNKVSIAATGGNTAFSTAAETAAVTVTTPHFAPSLDASGDMSLTPVFEEDISHNGDTIADIIASAGGDRLQPTAGAGEGVALINTDQTNGTWEYSLDNGTTWVEVGTVTETSALLLRDVDRIRFVPATDYSGTMASAVTFRGWDQMTGVAGARLDTSVNGGTSAFSSTTETASQEVINLPDAPLVDLDSTSGQLDGTCTYDPGSGAITLLPDAVISDPDSATVSGLRIELVNRPDGALEYLQLANALGAGISINHTASTGPDVAQGQYTTLVLTGAATIAEYQAALQQLQYHNDSPAEGTHPSDRLIQVTAFDADVPSLVSDARTVVLTVNPTLDLDSTDPVALHVEMEYQEDSGPMAVAPLASASSGQDITKITIRLINPEDGSAESLSAISSSSIQVTGNGSQSLVLTGTAGATASDYAAVVSSLVYENTSQAPVAGDRVIEFLPSTLNTTGAVRTATITVVPVNDAPALTPGNVFDLAGGETGTTVSALLNSGAVGAVSDVDSPSIGAAVVGTGIGNWEYSTDGGATWQSIGTVTNANALLLQGQDRIRFVAPADATGDVQSNLALRLWDESEHAAGQYVATTVNGDSSSFSSETAIVAANAAGTAEPEPEPEPPAEPEPDTPPPAVVNPGGGTPSAPSSPTTPGSEGNNSWSSGSDAGSGQSETPSTGTDSVLQPEGDNTSVSDVTDTSSSSSSNDSMDSDSADDSGFTAETAATDSAEEDAAMAIAHRDLDQNALNGVDELIGNLGMLNVIDELLIDDSHPGELREAWETILDAYAVRGDELSAYLESAFKTVIESTLVFQSAEREIELLEEVLRKAEEAGLQIDSDALLAEIREARENVKQASDQLRAAIAAAGEKGRAGQFDQALEDVIIAALRQLEQRNERLFVDSHVIEAVRTHVQQVLDADDPSAGNLQIEAIASESRAEATQQFTEMRERWDAAAQDVFSAFLARMVSGRANQGQMQDVQTYNLNTPQSPDQQ